MWSKRFSSIKPREWVAGSIVCLLMLGGVPGVVTLWHWLFVLPPMVVDWSEPEMRPNGLWRVTREVTIRERCGTVVWRRWFRSEGSPDRQIDAVASSTASLSAVSVGGRGEPGTYEDWWEYRPIPGLKGARIVTGTFADCPSGFSGVIDLYVTPFDWTDIRRN
jgi:hypothetical protein